MALRFSRRDENSVLKKQKMSIDLPRGKRSFPKNFCSSWKIVGIKLLLILKTRSQGDPDFIENVRHLTGFSFMPMDLIFESMRFISLW